MVIKSISNINSHNTDEIKEKKLELHLNVPLCPFRERWLLSLPKTWLCLCHLKKKRTKAEMEAPCIKFYVTCFFIII